MAMKFNYDFGVSTITVDAPIGGTTVGVPFVYGPIILVPDSSESAGDPVACVFLGKATGAPKVSAQAWTEKDVLYWDTVNSAFTNVAGVYKSCGIAAADAANPSSTGEVILGLGSEADSDVNTLIANLASTAGAGTIGILDAATDYTATTVEGALAEVKVIADANAVHVAGDGSDHADVATNSAAIVGGFTVPGGDPTVAATNPNPITVVVNDALGTPVTDIHRVFYWFSDTALGAIATAPDQASTATTGTILEDETAASGAGRALTDASGVLVLAILHNAGALADKFVNFECGGKVESQQYSFT